MTLRQFQRALAKRVRELRAAHGMTQDELDRPFGLSWKTIQKLEYEKTDPKVSTLLKLAAAFKMELTELLTFPEPPPRD